MREQASASRQNVDHMAGEVEGETRHSYPRNEHSPVKLDNNERGYKREGMRQKGKGRITTSKYTQRKVYKRIAQALERVSDGSVNPLLLNAHLVAALFLGVRCQE